MENDTKVKALKILNRGPEYYRETIFNRDSGLFRSPHRRSAVELLQETKSLYQRNESSPQTPQELLRPQSVAGSDHVGDAIELWHSSVDISTSCISPTTPPAKPPVPPRRRGLGIQCHVTQSLHNLSSVGMLPGGKDKVAVVTSPRLTLPSSPANDVIASDSDVEVAGSDNVKDVVEETESQGQREQLLDLSELSLKRVKYDSTNGLDSSLYNSSDVTMPRRAGSSQEVELRPERSRSRSRANGSETQRLSNVSTSSGAKGKDSDAELERFFDDMGCLDLGVTAVTPLGPAHSTASLNSLEGASSLDSDVRAESFPSHDSLNGVGNDSAVAKQHGSSADEGRGVGGALITSSPALAAGSSGGSIVERNARIIKWLCNVKRANSKDNVA